MPEVMTIWNIDVISLPDLQARGFNIMRGQPLDIMERRRAAVDKFTDRQWKYFSFCPLEYHEYTTPLPPPSIPPTISDVIFAPLFTSIIVSYTAADDVEMQSAYICRVTRL